MSAPKFPTYAAIAPLIASIEMPMTQSSSIPVSCSAAYGYPKSLRTIVATGAYLDGESRNDNPEG